MPGKDETRGDDGIEDPLKPKEKNLLDNVSLMTTISPMPSQNNSLQPQAGANTQDLLDDLFGNTGKRAHTNERNMSTTTAIEEKLLAQLDDTGVTLGSTIASPADTLKTAEDARHGKVMYGFDLSPIHSIDKGSAYTTTQEDLQSTEKLRNRGEYQIAPNFMQAKVASRQLKSEKSGAIEDTETVMSQVFSSQDVTSSVNDNFLMTSKGDLELHGSTGLRQINEPRSKPAVTVRPKTKGGTAKPKGKVSDKTNDITQSLKQQGSKQATNTPMTTPKERVPVARSALVKKASSAPVVEVVTPKSPKTRRSAVKVTPRMKTTTKKMYKKPLSQKTNQPKRTMSPSTGSTRKSHEGSRSSPTHSRAYKSSLDLSVSSFHHSKTKKTHEETVSLIHILEDLNEMRGQVAEAQEQLSAVTNERDVVLNENKHLHNENSQLKKDNFVLKSKLDKLTSNKNDDSVNLGKDSGDDEVAKLKQDIAEQERLILGYQRENERIYGELKKAKEDNRETEQAMYEENLKLKSEIAKLTEEIEVQSAINKAHGQDSDTMAKYGSNPQTVVRDQPDIMKNKISSLQNQIRAEEGLRLKAESLVRKITEERDKAEKQLTVNSCKMEEERQKLIIEHKAEVGRLKSELVEVRRLVASKQDSLTIRDLMNSPPSKSMLTHFQKRVKKLESDLENRDTMANKAVASVQQQYTDIKSKYEKRIDDLEKQIRAFRENMKKDTAIGSGDLVKEKEMLEKKLSEALLKLKEESENRVRERNTLFDQINILRKQQAEPQEKKAGPNDLSVKEQKLLKECEQKDQEITRLSSLVHKLSENPPNLTGDRRLRIKSNKGEKKSTPNYNPDSFEGEGYSDLLAQNAELKKKLETKELEHKHSEVTKEAVIAKLEQEVKTQKAAYESELMQARENIRERSETFQARNILLEKISQLQKDLSRQGEENAALRTELKEASVAKIREQALQVQIQQLVGKLHDVQMNSPSSSTRKIKVLEDKLLILEEQLRIKDQELRMALIQDSGLVIQKELRNMQSEIDRKNSELTKFRLELDSILLVLKELHSQGVKIPLPKYLQSIF